jgi:hypothetical protein
MKFFTRSEVEHFLIQNGYEGGLAGASEKLNELDDYCIHFPLPTEHGKLLSAIRFIFNSNLECSWLLLIIEAAGIWPSWEDRNLYGLLRSVKGGSSDWSYGAGHLFDMSELEDVITFVTVFSNFRWDYRMIGSNNGLHLFGSHDDFGVLYLKNMTHEFDAEFSIFFK